MFFVICSFILGAIIAAGISYYKLYILSGPIEHEAPNNFSARPSPSDSPASNEPNTIEPHVTKITSPSQLKERQECRFCKMFKRQEVTSDIPRRSVDDKISVTILSENQSSESKESRRQSNPAVDPIISPRKTKEMYIIPSTSINVKKSLDQGTPVEFSGSSGQSSLQTTENEDV